MICSRSPASLTGILLSSAVVSYLFVVFIVSVSSNQTFRTSRFLEHRITKIQKNTNFVEYLPTEFSLASLGGFSSAP